MVSRDVPSVKPGSTSDLEALDTVRMLVESMSEEGVLLCCCAAVLHVEHTAINQAMSQQGRQLCVTAMCTLAWCCLVGAAQMLSRLEIK